METTRRARRVVLAALGASVLAWVVLATTASVSGLVASRLGLDTSRFDELEHAERVLPVLVADLLLALGVLAPTGRAGRARARTASVVALVLAAGLALALAAAVVAETPSSLDRYGLLRLVAHLLAAALQAAPWVVVVAGRTKAPTPTG